MMETAPLIALAFVVGLGVGQLTLSRFLRKAHARNADYGKMVDDLLKMNEGLRAALVRANDTNERLLEQRRASLEHAP